LLRATGFYSSVRLTEHFGKHGSEFEATTEQEYLLKAAVFINTLHSNPDTLFCNDEDGDFVLFNPETDEFAVATPDGRIRTYFKPVPAHLAEPNRPAKMMHRFRSNLEFFQDKCA
jgi:pyocin large subunit-like protein